MKDPMYRCKRCGMDTLSIVTVTGERKYTCGTIVDRKGMLMNEPTFACREVAKLKAKIGELQEEIDGLKAEVNDNGFSRPFQRQ